MYIEFSTVTFVEINSPADRNKFRAGVADVVPEAVKEVNYKITNDNLTTVTNIVVSEAEGTENPIVYRTYSCCMLMTRSKD